MGYQVIYDGEKGEQRNGHRFRLIPLTGVAFLAFLLLVDAYWPRGREVLRAYLLPEAVDSALTVVTTFAERILSGEALPVAWEAFCHEIIH